MDNKIINKDKEKTIKIGQEVFMIDNKLLIIKETVIGILNEKEKIRYKVHDYSCGGVSEEDLFLTEFEAEIAKQDFLDKLKYKIGDLVVFKTKDYDGVNNIRIGRISNIVKGPEPYKIENQYFSTYNSLEKCIILKIKNSYIENYGKLQELYMKFDKTKDELKNIEKEIHYEFNILEKELKQSFKKDISWWNIKNKPLFKDRFEYDDYY